MKTKKIALLVPHDKRSLLHITKSTAAFSEDESLQPMLLVTGSIHPLTKEEDIPSEAELQEAEEQLLAISLNDAIHLANSINRLLIVANQKGLLKKDEETGAIKLKDS